MIPKSPRTEEWLVSFKFSFTSASRVSSPPGSLPLLLFLGRPICFCAENMHTIFSLWHLVQLGLSPEHFSFRVPGIRPSVFNTLLGA